jgi:ubiquitin-conjugating enzyme E2 I
MAEAAARSRLASERKQLLETKPAGCFARPTKRKDGSVDLFNWEAGITPAPSSIYALPQAGSYRLMFEFKPDFPATPPLVRFSPAIFHTNVWPSGAVCMSLLLPPGHHPGAGHKGHWQGTLTIGEILKAMQVFLDEPNANSVFVCRARTSGALLQQS